MENVTLYEILGLQKNANDDQIKKAYRALAKEHHPDVGGEPDLFHTITFAYAILSNHTKKLLYDKTGVVQDNTEEEQIILAAESNLICIFEEQINGYDEEIIYQDVVDNSFKILSGTVMDRHKELERKVNEVQKVVRLLQGRMSCKGDKNVYDQLVQDKIQKLERDISEISLQIKILNKAKELLTEYEFKKDEKKILQSPWALR